MLSFEALVERRNQLQLLGEHLHAGEECSQRLGAANRDLARLAAGTAQLTPGLEREILLVLEGVSEWLYEARKCHV